MKFIKENELFLLEEIVKKNFSSKYKDSVLGILWSVLKPLLIMILFTIIFSTVFGSSIEYFPVYFLSGRCIFDFFIAAVTVSMNSIRGNKSILQVTAATKYIFVLAGIVSEFLNFIISFIILIAVMIVLKVPFYFNVMPFSVIPIISLLILMTGIGLMLSILCVYYSDIQHLWGVISIMLMYASALFYPIEIVPEPYRGVMMLNPLYWVVSQFRCFIYQGTFPSILSIINLFLLSLIVLVIGVIIFKKFEDKISMKF